EVVGEAELPELLGGIGVDHTAAGVDHRALRVGERLGGDPDLLDVALGGGLVPRQVRRLGDRLVVDVGPREVLWNIDQNGPGPAGGGDVEGGVDVLGDRARVLNHQAVLDDRHGDAVDVGLLEAIRADQVGADLARDEDGRDRVHDRVRDRGDQVGRARAG